MGGWEACEDEDWRTETNYLTRSTLWRGRRMTAGAFGGGRFRQYKLREEERSLRRGGRRMTAGAFSGGRFCQYKFRDEERSLRRGGRRITPRNPVGGFVRLFKSVYIYIYTQIEFFRENSNLFPEVARSKCRDLFLVNIMRLLWFLSMFYRLACMVCAHERRTAGATLAPASTAAG